MRTRSNPEIVGLVQGTDFVSRPVRMLTSRADDGYMRIMIGDYGSALFELLEQAITRRFTFIVNVRLVGQTEDEDSASFDGLSSRR